MREHILPLADTRLIMAIDRVDAVWRLPFKDDCFGMLRAWAQDKRLRKLRLISRNFNDADDAHRSADTIPV